jgi:acetolactate synthase-1/2/3 large subunit
MLATEGAYLLEAQVIQKGMVYPMVPAGASITNILMN